MNLSAKRATLYERGEMWLHFGVFSVQIKKAINLQVMSKEDNSVYNLRF